MKKFFTILLTLCVIFSFISIPYAATRGISGYGHRVTGTAGGYFTVNVTGKPGLFGGITIRNDCSSNSFLNITIVNPNGVTFQKIISMKANREQKFKIFRPNTGVYKIYYNAYTPEHPIHIQCWIYG